MDPSLPAKILFNYPYVKSCNSSGFERSRSLTEFLSVSSILRLSRAIRRELTALGFIGFVVAFAAMRFVAPGVLRIPRT